MNMGPKPGMGGKPVAKPKNTWQTTKRLMSYMKKSLPAVILTVIIAIGGTVMQVLSPKTLGRATTVIFDGIKSGAGIDFNNVLQILLIVAALYAGVFITSFLQQRIMVKVTQKTTYTLRNELKAKMNRVPVSYFDENANGNLMSVAANDIDNIVTNLQQSMTSLIGSVILVVGMLWIMFSISWLLTVIALCIIPGSLLIMKLTTPHTTKNNQAYFKSLGELNGQIEETYQGFTVIKSFNGEADALKKFEQVNQNMAETGWRSRFFGGMNVPGMNLVQNITYVLIAAVGCVNVVSGVISIGNMQAFLQYSGQFSTPMMSFSQIWSNLLYMVASAERVFEMLDAKEIVEYDQVFPNIENESVKVVFDHVKFSYTDEPLMKDFSMEVQNGQMVAIVGHTGAGKTTLINLLECFYEIQSGSIRIDGMDIRNLSKHELRKKMGMVLQDTWLFSGTIFDNIKYGNECATDDQVYAAAKAAFVDDFVRKLPDGYNTVLNEEASNISEGQRQLITIARAFVSDPEILILDEATSNVDSRTEMVIQSAMKRLLKGHTSFVVAHRLSTIYDADRILVMDKGDIVETGTHKELLIQNGTYADIYNSQFAVSAA
jgi:ABC-type multidrug transport system fused ATPase/permease subunit